MWLQGCSFSEVLVSLFCGELLVLLSQHFFKDWQMSIYERLGRSGDKMVVWLEQPVGQIAMQVLGSGWPGRDSIIWNAGLRVKQ